MVAYFPSVEELLTILMSELPEGVYPEDRADNPDPNLRSFSSAELRAMATLIAILYTNLGAINADKFLTTVTVDGLLPWEKELFTSAQDATQSPTLRQQNLISKLRANGGISLPAISAVVAGILDPVGLSFQILPYSGQSNGEDTGAWVLEESELEGGTYLAARDPIWGAQTAFIPLDCSLNWEAAGITQQDLLDIQATAYTYEVQIFGDASPQTLALLDQQLTALEPARSTHVITNNVSQAPVDPQVYGWNTSQLPWWVG